MFCAHVARNSVGERTDRVFKTAGVMAARPYGKVAHVSTEPTFAFYRGRSTDAPRLIFVLMGVYRGAVARAIK